MSARLASVARALALRPRIVLADEPTAGASAAAGEAMLRLLAPGDRTTGRAAARDRRRGAGGARRPRSPRSSTERQSASQPLPDHGAATLRLLDAPEATADESAR